MEIQGHENYLIYPDGRVFSKKRNIFMKQLKRSNNYYYYPLNKNGIQKNATVHRLLAIHYIPNPQNKPIVDHIDRNSLNNDISNLRWATHSENAQNTIKQKRNTSGHKNIVFDKKWSGWKYHKKYKNVIYQRSFKSKIDCLCYKYIMILKLRILTE